MWVQVNNRKPHARDFAVRWRLRSLWPQSLRPSGLGIYKLSGTKIVHSVSNHGAYEKDGPVLQIPANQEGATPKIQPSRVSFERRKMGNVFLSRFLSPSILFPQLNCLDAPADRYHALSKMHKQTHHRFQQSAPETNKANSKCRSKIPPPTKALRSHATLQFLRMDI